MATLETTYAELRKQIGRYLGYGDGVAVAWSTLQSDDIARCLKNGLRLFLSPPVLPGERHAHRWRFSMPTTTLDTAADTPNQTLLTALGIVGPLRYSEDSAVTRARVAIVTADRINFLRAQGETSGAPQYVAIVPLASNQTGTQAWQLQWYPTPDGIYTLVYQYNLESLLLDGTAVYPIGGSEHSRTLEAACIAEAEKIRYDAAGPMWDDFIRALATSVSLDRQLNRPTTLGIMPSVDVSLGSPESERHNHIEGGWV